MDERILAVYHIDPVSGNTIIEELKRSFAGESFIIKGFSEKEGLIGPYRADLVLASGYYTLNNAKRYFPNCTVIPMTRFYPNLNIDKLLSVETGKTALVASHPRQSSENVINRLKEMGITHINYEPFWQGKTIRPNKYDLIITPGMPHICPSGITEIIDIGVPGPSVYTYAQIINHFGLDLSYLYSIETKHIQIYFEYIRKMCEYLNSSKRDFFIQNTALNKVNEGLAVLDENHKMVFYNEKLKTDISVDSSGQWTSFTDNLIKNDKAHPDTINSSFFYNNTLYYCTKSSLGTVKDKYYFYSLNSVNQLQRQLDFLNEHKTIAQTRYSFDDLWGDNKVSKNIRDIAKRYAATDQPILILGESGTGKEILAQSIHRSSSRSGGSFIDINLSVIPESLMASELFGYEEGSFTGAKRSGKKGAFELADHGTLFLDEIADIPNSIQVLLLRVLEENEIRRVGSEGKVKVDVRVIAATNKDLYKEVKEHRFRMDLFFRLNVLSIETNPLRNMRNEIHSFIEKYIKERFHVEKQMSLELISFLEQYNWPGNFRELKNVCEFLYYTEESGASVYELKDLPPYILSSSNGEKRMKQLGEDKDAVINSKRAMLILNEYFLANNNPIGRRDIIANLAVKTTIKRLKSRGLIASGTTRQGSFITEKGRLLCAEVNSDVEQSKGEC